MQHLIIGFFVAGGGMGEWVEQLWRGGRYSYAQLS